MIENKIFYKSVIRELKKYTFKVSHNRESTIKEIVNHRDRYICNYSFGTSSECVAVPIFTPELQNFIDVDRDLLKEYLKSIIDIFKVTISSHIFTDIKIYHINYKGKTYNCYNKLFNFRNIDNEPYNISCDISGRVNIVENDEAYNFYFLNPILETLDLLKTLKSDYPIYNYDDYFISYNYALRIINSDKFITIDEA